MAPRSARGSISRPTLIWIIVAAFLIASGVGIYFAVRKGSRSAAPAGAALNLDAPPPPAPPAEQASLQSDDGRAQFVDKDDPNRLAGEMLYRRLDPLPRGRYALEEPQLWLFMKDGRTLHVRANKGNVKFFQGTEKPESGRFEGGVVARIYAKGVATATVRPDPQVIAPEMLAYTESLVFDLSLGEFSTQDVVNLSDASKELQGKGLTIVFNEVRGSVASIELGAVGFLHVSTKGANRPGARDKAPASSPVAGVAHAPAPGAAASATPPKPPKIDLYTTEIFGPVSLTIGTEAPQSISADKLLIWARLVDGELPPDAIYEIRAKQPPKPVEATASPALPAGAVPPGAVPGAGVAKPQPSLRDRILSLRVKGPGGIEPLTAIAGDDALLTWGGRLIATAVETTPPELDAEHVAGRFVSESDQPVIMLDARSGTTILSESSHYGATTAQTDIRGKDGKPPTLADARGGHAELPALTLNLKTGVSQSRGPGYLFRRDPVKKTESGEPVEQRLTWTEQADFEFGPGAKDGSGLEQIRSARFAGSVRGIDEKAEISSDFLQADFMDSSAGESILKRVQLKGGAFAKTLAPEKPQSLTADAFDLIFKPDEKGKDAIPDMLIATGATTARLTELLEDKKDKSIRTERKSKLTSGSLEAKLMRDEKGDVTVSTAVARDNAAFTRSDGVSASGDEISVNAVDKTVDVVGANALVAARGATLTARDLHLDGGHEAAGPDAFYGVVAKGPGRLDHIDSKPPKLEEGQRPALTSEELGRTTLTWSKGMRFNDAKGEGDAVGDVVAITHPDAFTRNTVRGSRMSMRTSHTPETPGESKPKTDEENPLGDLRLLRAEVIADEGAPRAIAEQRTYVVDDTKPEGRRLEKMTYIEGPRLIADEENGVFEVPAAGRALVLDHTVAKEKEEAARTSTPFGSTSGQGTTLIEWRGSIKMQRAVERADAVGGVVITHKPLDPSEKPIVLSSDAVEIHFKLAPKGTTGATTTGEKQRDQLVRAAAVGSVVITSENGTKELTADTASYDAVNGVIEASATQEHSAVAFLDKTKGVPSIARKMRWNLKTDQIDVVEPMPGAVPIK